MSKNATEARHGQAEGLDRLGSDEILRLLASGQQAAAQAVDRAIPAIAKAADLLAASVQNGGKLVYAGAGSAGLAAMADALELPGTYGIPSEQLVVLLAGGLSNAANLPGGPEDDADLGRSDGAVIGSDDCVICVSASGATPYTVAVAGVASQRGAKLVAIASNENAPLFAGADVSILLQTPPEVIAGSTRMGAATAQKIALNMLSTLAAIRLGHVHDGLMVNLRADNEKLRLRAARMVVEITGADLETATRCMALADGSVKVAVLLASGAESVEEAKAALARSGQVLRRALEQFENSTVCRSTGSMKRA